jgi:hypothetical protein
MVPPSESPISAIMPVAPAFASATFPVDDALAVAATVPLFVSSVWAVSAL